MNDRHDKQPRKRVNALPEPASVRGNLHLFNRQWDEIDRIVRETRRTRSDIVRELIEYGLAAQRPTAVA